MSNEYLGYLDKNRPVEELATIASRVLTQMVGGTTNTFTLESKGFSSSSPGTSSFISSETKYNKGTWGNALTTSYTYQNNPLPFVDRKSTPSFHLVSTSGTTIVKQFPETDSISNQGTSIKYIPAAVLDTEGTLLISYDTGTCHLSVTKNNVSYLSVRANSNILIDLQAAGGSGGTSTVAKYTQERWPLKDYNYYGLGAGGGGGSGGFISISVDLSKKDLQVITFCTNAKPTSYGIASSDFKAGAGEILTVYVGQSGVSGTAEASGKNPTATSGTGGAGGSITYTYLAGPSSWGENITAGGGLVSNLIYVIDAIPGCIGGNGGTKIESRWEDISTKKCQGNAPAANISSKLLLTSVESSSTSCTLLGTTTASSLGSGENVNTSNVAVVVGGGGGGRSLMANGGTYSTNANYRPGIGAGGYGASAWLEDDGANGGGNSYNDSGKIAGGPGGMWIYYIFEGVIAPVIIQTNSQDDSGYVYYNYDVTNNNSFDVEYVCWSETDTETNPTDTRTLKAGETWSAGGSTPSSFILYGKFKANGIESEISSCYIS